jgi:hypothetical protein
MTANHKKHNYLFLTITWFGLLCFVLFFILGAEYYPGGSNVNPKSNGFNWLTNYWSELLGNYAKNGQQNTARPFGISGAISLAVTLSIFWIYIPSKLNLIDGYKRIIQFAGLLAMVCSVLIFGQAHDVFITLSVMFGSIAFLILLIGLWNSNYTFLFWWCLSCLALILLNTVIYLTNWNINSLAALQKITFIVGIAWTAFTTTFLSIRR